MKLCFVFPLICQFGHLFSTDILREDGNKKNKKNNRELNICVAFPKVYLSTKFIYKNVALKK